MLRHPELTSKIEYSSICSCIEKFAKDHDGLDYPLDIGLLRAFILVKKFPFLDKVIQNLSVKIDRLYKGPFCSALVVKLYEELGVKLLVDEKIEQEQISPSDLANPKVSNLREVQDAIIPSDTMQEAPKIKSIFSNEIQANNLPCQNIFSLGQSVLAKMELLTTEYSRFNFLKAQESLAVSNTLACRALISAKALKKVNKIQSENLRLLYQVTKKT